MKTSTKLNIAEWIIWNADYPTLKNNEKINVIWIDSNSFKIYIDIDTIENYNKKGLSYAIKRNLIKDSREEWWNWANVNPSSIIPIEKMIYNHSIHDLSSFMNNCEIINIFSEWLESHNLKINDVYEEFHKKTGIRLNLSWEIMNTYENEMNKDKSLSDSEYENLINQIDSENEQFVNYLKTHSIYENIIENIKIDYYNETIKFVTSLMNFQ